MRGLTMGVLPISRPLIELVALHTAETSDAFLCHGAMPRRLRFVDRVSSSGLLPSFGSLVFLRRKCEK